MKILHISAECYPMAKAGGLGDVVGALPKYQQALDCESQVIVPMHRTAFLHSNEWDVVYKGKINWKGSSIDFTVIKERYNVLGFELFCMDINGLLDRTNIYGYNDDADRFLAFQIACLHWISSLDSLPDVLHLHDHHTGLIPFMINYCFSFDALKNIKTLFTIHNAQYQGWMSLAYKNFLPFFDNWKSGLLEWDDQINSLACAVKCCDMITTVSPNYKTELLSGDHHLAVLFRQEKDKFIGILNGIDYNIWSAESDPMIAFRYDENHVDSGKFFNKVKICSEFSLNAELPLIVFIGRLVQEKSADLLADALLSAFEKYHHQFCCIVLGNGESHIEQELFSIQQTQLGYYHSSIEFNEQLSHQLYAGADFLLMPSRVEPCGLNQMYAMRYGTIPIVRSIGGLKDTVIDLNEHQGYGICFEHLSQENIVNAIGRAIDTYVNKNVVNEARKNMMRINNNWTKSATEYIDIYAQLIQTHDQ